MDCSKNLWNIVENEISIINNFNSVGFIIDVLSIKVPPDPFPVFIQIIKGKF